MVASTCRADENRQCSQQAYRRSHAKNNVYDYPHFKIVQVSLIKPSSEYSTFVNVLVRLVFCDYLSVFIFILVFYLKSELDFSSFLSKVPDLEQPLADQPLLA